MPKCTRNLKATGWKSSYSILLVQRFWKYLILFSLWSWEKRQNIKTKPHFSSSLVQEPKIWVLVIHFFSEIEWNPDFSLNIADTHISLYNFKFSTSLKWCISLLSFPILCINLWPLSHMQDKQHHLTISPTLHFFP